MGSLYLQGQGKGFVSRLGSRIWGLKMEKMEATMLFRV